MTIETGHEFGSNAAELQCVSIETGWTDLAAYIVSVHSVCAIKLIMCQAREERQDPKQPNKQTMAHMAVES